MKYRQILCFAIASSLITACADGDTKYTLYRSGIDFSSNSADISMRIHVATFDATEKSWSQEDQAKYNQANCDFAQELFTAKQPHINGTAFGPVKMKYWCEKGGYKK